MPSGQELRMIAMTGCVGYGFTETSFERLLAQGVDFIAADAGSMDPGPYYLGAGVPFVSNASIERDVRVMLKGARKHGVPVIIGSAGGGGGKPHVELVRSIIRRIAAAENLRFRLAVIDAEPPRELILERLRAGRIKALWPLPDLTEARVRESARIVAMMGAEPIQAALRGGADVVLAGRSSDSALYAAVPLMRGFDPALAWHLGKTIECGAAIVRPKTSQDCVLGVLRGDHFVVEPGHPEKRCTPESVASHTMYENPSPYEFLEPAGVVDTRHCRYEAIDARSVRVSGSRFESAAQYTVKLEGARLRGYRSICVGGVCDPVLISRIDAFTAQLHERTRAEAATLDIRPEQYTLVVRRYGLDAVSHERRETPPNEIGVMLEVVADTPDAAAAVLAKARYILMHTEFEGRLCTAGNLALPFAPSDVAVGPAYEFSVWHAMELDDPLEIFPIAYEQLGGSEN